MIFVIPWEDSVSIPIMGSPARLTGFVAAGFWLATIAIEGKFRKPNLFHALVLFFFLWNFISLFWSFDIDNTIQRIKTYSQIFLLMLICWDVFREPEDLTAGLGAYVLGAYVLIASTIYNFMAGNVAVQYEGRYSATGVNANDVALILILGIPIGLPVVMQFLFTPSRSIKRFWQQLINLLYIPLAVFSIVLTGSRTSIIAIIPFGVFLIGTQWIKIERKILICVVLLVLLLILLPLVPSTVIQRMGTIGASIRGADLGGRVTMWEKSIVVFAQYPIWGVGSGAVDHMIGGAVHNTFISVVTETGFIGLILFLAILGLVVYRVVTLPKETSALWLSIYVTWLIGIVSLSWEFRKVTWILLSFMVIESSFRKRADKQEQNVSLSRHIEPSFETDESAPQPGLP